jgi:O-methyltransferase
MESLNSRFVKSLFHAYGSDLVPLLPEIREHNVTARERLGLSGGSTGNADCGFLYLLVRAFKRRSIFEIGTYVGTSAVAMSLATRGNGGTVVTCDPEDYGSLPLSANECIQFLHMPSEEALALLKRENKTVDFVFADWAPSRQAIELINDLSTDDFIFSAHDYVLPNDKGVVAKKLMTKHYKRIGECTWILPDEEPVQVAPGIELQQCTAVLIPNRLLAEWG